MVTNLKVQCNNDLDTLLILVWLTLWIFFFLFCCVVIEFRIKVLLSSVIFQQLYVSRILIDVICRKWLCKSYIYSEIIHNGVCVCVKSQRFYDYKHNYTRLRNAGNFNYDLVIRSSFSPLLKVFEPVVKVFLYVRLALK